MKVLIVIPARYGSTRFPGKPLATISGQSMLSRVAQVAQDAAEMVVSSGIVCDIVVATEDTRIMEHCQEAQLTSLLTDASCITGTDRAFDTYKRLGCSYDAIINLQGDAPLTPPHFVASLIEEFRTPGVDVVTPVIQLSWAELDSLRRNKQSTPFSGTTVVVDQAGFALWFSKQIIPAIRSESILRDTNEWSPVLRHVGLYGYTPATLERFTQLDQSDYERIEGLEQLRLLENGYRIKTVKVEHNGIPCFTGVDSPEDIARVEAILKAA